MDEVTTLFHSIGKSLRVCLEMTLRISLGSHPAIIDVDVVVANFLEAKILDFECSILDNLRVDVTVESVP